MAYELRLPGQSAQEFDTEAEAVDAAKAALAADPDCEPEVIDAATGKPAAPGASKAWREELRNSAGF